MIPSSWCEEYSLEGSEGSKAGEYYVAANGKHICTIVQRTLNVGPYERGDARSITFQVCDVSKAVASVSKPVNNGYTVVFSRSGFYIQSGHDRRKIRLR